MFCVTFQFSHFPKPKNSKFRFLSKYRNKYLIMPIRKIKEIIGVNIKHFFFKGLLFH